MSLIICPECSREISDQAGSCPGCGFPVKSPAILNSKPKGKYSALAITSFGLGLASIFMPYFAAVFIVPAALICGIITYTRGLGNVGIITIFLALIGLANITFVSEQIKDIDESVKSMEQSRQSIERILRDLK